MKPIVRVDANQLVVAMREMQKRLGMPTIKPIIENEVKSILQKSASLTKKGSAKKIKKSIFGRIPEKKIQGRKVSQPGMGSQNRRTRPDDGSGWITTPDGRKWQRSWTIPDSEWNGMMQKKKDDLKETLARIGLSAQTWLQIANDLNLLIEVQKRVANAKVNGAIIRHKASARKDESDQNNFVIYISNDNPLSRYTGARSALQKAINGRVGFFKANARNGVFNNLSAVAKKYPGLNVGP